jgi:DNA-binding PucR family transcriptional regulator
VAGNEGLPELEKFVQHWLGDLADYDAARGTQLVLTLAEYLDHDGSVDATAAVLAVHRNTVRYRLRRVRELSGHDLGLPDTLFHLQLATRAWRTLQARGRQ